MLSGFDKITVPACALQSLSQQQEFLSLLLQLLLKHSLFRYIYFFFAGTYRILLHQHHLQMSVVLGGQQLQMLLTQQEG